MSFMHLPSFQSYLQNGIQGLTQRVLWFTCSTGPILLLPVLYLPCMFFFSFPLAAISSSLIYCSDAFTPNPFMQLFVPSKTPPLLFASISFAGASLPVSTSALVLNLLLSTHMASLVKLPEKLCVVHCQVLPLFFLFNFLLPRWTVCCYS